MCVCPKQISFIKHSMNNHFFCGLNNMQLNLYYNICILLETLATLMLGIYIFTLITITESWIKTFIKAIAVSFSERPVSYI